MPYKDREKLYQAQKRHRVKIRKLLLEFLSTQRCAVCKESDPIVLDFDHKRRDTKFKPISLMMSGHYSWKSLMKEIEKCQILCANCHRRKSYFESGGFGKTKMPL